MPDPLNFGHLIEGTVEQDPMTDEFQIRTVDAQGNPATVRINELFAQFVGQDVRLTVASFEALNQLAKLVEERGGGQVMGITPDQLPIPFNIRRK